ncbi:MAG TPA: DUF2993 domain-containing protein [Candidatus Ozemobacteraceae bacterium]|nr:DUF2993 domain-containing protein [Candidatus Ozemobacteraceae bacterium]
MMMPGHATPASGADQLLAEAFSTAFRDPEEFRATGLFEKLGYAPDQVRAMAEITPRPASLTVEAEPAGDASGAFRLIRVRCSGVQYYNLTIDHAGFEFPDVRVDPEALANGHLRFVSAGRIDLETHVSADDILKVFRFFAKAQRLSQMSLRIAPQETVLTGNVRKGIFVARFRVNGQPKLISTDRIAFDCRKMDINGVPLPAAAIRAMFSRINPVFDARKTWLNLKLREMGVESGFVATKATIHPAQATAASATSILPRG